MAGSPDPHVRPLSPSLPPSAAADFAADLAADEALAFELATGADGSLAFDAGSQQHIPHTTFTVDAFAYGKISGCTAYFLTHFHSDHYGGLRKSFDHGALWCSAVTANLVAQQIGVDRSFLHVLPLDTPTEIEGVRVTFIDANQLIMILFEVPRMGSDGAQTGTYRLLHTGDFRASPAHLEHLALAPFVRAQGGSVSIGTDKADDDDASAPAIDDLFLDTTYCQPKHVFPPQTAVIDAICELVKGVAAGKTVQTIVNPKNTVARFFVAKPRGGAVGAAAGTLFSWMGGASAPPRPLRVLIVVGSYLIGKERVFKALAKAVGTKVFADADKRRILARLADRELDGMMTSRPEDANVHVVGMGKLNKEHLAAMLARHKDRFSEVIAVRPTGWTFGGRGPGKGRADDDGEPAPFTVQSLAVQHLAHNIKLVPLPYSEHSSFSELEMFVRGLRVASIVPTVSEASTALLRRFCVRRTRG
nr:DNA break repair nuclease [Polyrhizophydium stewartii]